MRSTTSGLVRVAAALAIAVATGACSLDLTDGAACPPDCNVILISIDTLRADHLGAYGYERDTSPNLDRFARDAVVFENAISQSAWTTPAHASMMTGLYPWEHGLVFYKNPGRLADEVTTLAELLGARGYRTAGFNGGGYVSDTFGLGAGFEIYEGTRFFRHNVDASIDWLERHGDERFFLFLHAYDVHRPYIVPKPFDVFSDPEARFDMRGFCDSGQHPYEDEEELAYIVSQYDAGIRYADYVVGEFLSHLHNEGLLDRSIVVVTSDHGDELFEHGACDHIKSVYEELVHVPLMIRVPGAGARRVSSPVPASVAVTPTVLELLGAETGKIGERSVAPLLRGEPGTPEGIISETGRGGGNGTLRYWRGLRTDRWKLVYARRGADERFELYDLRDDPLEQNDVISAKPAVFERMKAELLRPPFRTSAPSQAHIDPETVEALRALGYVD
jgi:arylsulfatase A-like enzyme